MTNALENAIAELRSIFSAIEQEHSMKKMARLRCEHCKRSDSDTSPPSESETETETETESEREEVDEKIPQLSITPMNSNATSPIRYSVIYF